MLGKIEREKRWEWNSFKLTETCGSTFEDLMTRKKIFWAPK